MGVHHVPLFLVVILGSFLQTTQDNPDITVESCQHTDVILPCDCSRMTKELKWQKKNTSIYSNGSITKNNTDRITKVPDESSNNCAIGLKNISEEDGGEYKCNFNEGSVFSKSIVILIVITNSTECSAIRQQVKGNEDNSTSNNDASTHRPQVYIPLIIISALLLVVFIFAVLRIQLRNKDQLRNQPMKIDEEAALDPVTLDPMPLLLIAAV